MERTLKDIIIGKLKDYAEMYSHGQRVRVDVENLIERIYHAKIEEDEITRMKVILGPRWNITEDSNYYMFQYTTGKLSLKGDISTIWVHLILKTKCQKQGAENICNALKIIYE
jgi:hypothetical protein